MTDIVAANGVVVTDEMIDSWCQALDNDQWPHGWENVGPIIEGKPDAPDSGTVTLSVKIPVALKNALQEEARREGVTTSAYVRGLLAESLMNRNAA